MIWINSNHSPQWTFQHHLLSITLPTQKTLSQETSLTVDCVSPIVSLISSLLFQEVLPSITLMMQRALSQDLYSNCAESFWPVSLLSSLAFLEHLSLWGDNNTDHVSSLSGLPFQDHLMYRTFKFKNLNYGRPQHWLCSLPTLSVSPKWTAILRTSSKYNLTNSNTTVMIGHMYHAASSSWVQDHLQSILYWMSRQQYTGIHPTQYYC